MKGVRPESGRIVGGRYRLLDRLGRGSIGEVWLAEHQALGSKVAIKFLRGRARRDPWLQERFFDEARIAARLPSRHVARVHDVASMEDGRPYVVMEYLDGETLEERLRRDKRLTPAFAARILLQVAKGLAKAHGAGIVHRDIKPENIFLTTDEDGCTEAKVLDFGIAKILGGLDDAGVDELPTRLGRTSGRLVGTPTHMAPEQTFGASAVGPAADIWAFGVVAYECLTGELPFHGSDLADLFLRIRGGDLREALRALDGVASHELELWFATVFAAEPERRFANMRSCAEGLAYALRMPMLSSPSIGAMVTTSPSSEPPRALSFGSGESSAPSDTPSVRVPARMPVPGIPESIAHAARPSSGGAAPAAPPRPFVSSLSKTMRVARRASPLLAVVAMLVAGATGAVVAVRIAPGVGVSFDAHAGLTSRDADVRARATVALPNLLTTRVAEAYDGAATRPTAPSTAPITGDEVGPPSSPPRANGPSRPLPSALGAGDIPELSSYRAVPY